MRFLKTLLWVILAVGIVVFAVNNWDPVSVRLWGGLRLDTKLAALVIAAFAVGFLPLYLFHRTIIWRLKRRIQSMESAMRPATPTFPPPSPPVAAPLGPVDTSGAAI